MPSTTIVAPAEMPVSLAEAKQVLLIDHTADDAQLIQMIAAATAEAESLTARSLTTQTREIVASRWPADNCFRLEHPPVQSIVSVTYITADNQPLTVPTADYQLIADITPPLLLPAQGGAWPSASLRGVAPIRVRYVAGYGAASTVPALYKRIILGLITVDYENREAISNTAAAQRLRLQAALKMNWGYAT